MPRAETIIKIAIILTPFVLAGAIFAKIMGWDR